MLHTIRPTEQSGSFAWQVAVSLPDGVGAACKRIRIVGEGLAQPALIVVFNVMKWIKCQCAGAAWRRALLCLLCVTTLMYAVPSMAQSENSFGQRGDPNWGFRFFADPRVTGERTVSVQIRNIRLDSNASFTKPIPANKLRVELQYRAASESWQTSRRSIAILEQDAELDGVYNARVVLPQNSQEQLFRYPPINNLPFSEYKLAHDYNRNASKMRAGELVEYRWLLRDSDGVRAYPTRRFVMPRPFSIVIMGDSFASGEGAPTEEKIDPDRPATSSHTDAGFNDFAKWGKTNNRWESRKAHRSNKSGFVQGVRHFERQADVWVETLHTAISSATIIQPEENRADRLANEALANGGMTGEFVGSREIFIPIGGDIAGGIQSLRDTGSWYERSLMQDVVIESQMDQAERWIVEENLGRADVVLLSIGGNDAGFGDLISNALRPSGLDDSLSGNLPANIIAMDEKLDSVTDHIPTFFANFDTIVRPRYFMWANYPDLTRNEQGRFKSLATSAQTRALARDITLAGAPAGAIGGIIGSIFGGPVGAGVGALTTTSAALIGTNSSPPILVLSMLVGEEDMQNAFYLVDRHLNPRIDDWCEQRNNCQVLDIQSRSFRHGITAEDSERWFNTFIDSQLIKCGGLDCAIHPNAKGHEEIYMLPVSEGLTRRYAAIIATERRTIERQEARDATRERIAAEEAERLRQLYETLNFKKYDLSHLQKVRKIRAEDNIKLHKDLFTKQNANGGINRTSESLGLSQHKLDSLRRDLQQVDSAEIKGFDEAIEGLDMGK